MANEVNQGAQDLVIELNSAFQALANARGDEQLPHFAKCGYLVAQLAAAVGLDPLKMLLVRPHPHTREPS